MQTLEAKAFKGHYYSDKKHLQGARFVNVLQKNGGDKKINS